MTAHPVTHHGTAALEPRPSLAPASHPACCTPTKENPMPGPLLTDNELAVLRGASEGDTYAVIASRLGLAEKSVGKIAFRLSRKLGAANITHAVLLACHAGILDGRPQRHGDHAGYAAHWYRGEEPCEACRRGERVYRNARRARTTPKPQNAVPP